MKIVLMVADVETSVIYRPYMKLTHGSTWRQGLDALDSTSVPPPYDAPLPLRTLKRDEYQEATQNVLARPGRGSKQK